MNIRLSLLSIFVFIGVQAMEEETLLTTMLDKNLLMPGEIDRSITKPDSVVINWYIGESGITEEGARFYKKNIFEPILNDNSDVKFHLYDLTAWQALRNKKCSFDTQSKIVGAIAALRNANFKGVPSSDFFKDLASRKDIETLNAYHDILNNQELHKPSLSRKPNGITVGQVLPYEVLKPIHHMDTAHAYSALQYLEGIYLVKNALVNHKAKNVTLLLPNDEYKYYVTPRFINDVFNTLYTTGTLNDVRINVKGFAFGNKTTDRPYILRDKKIAPTQIKDYLPCEK